VPTLFVVSKDEWVTKEGTGKSIKNWIYSGMAKAISQAEATSNSEKIKLVAITIVEFISTRL